MLYDHGEGKKKTDASGTTFHDTMLVHLPKTEFPWPASYFRAAAAPLKLQRFLIDQRAREGLQVSLKRINTRLFLLKDFIAAQVNAFEKPEACLFRAGGLSLTLHLDFLVGKWA